MTELRTCCNCDEYYHYHDSGDYENDPDYCGDCNNMYNREVDFYVPEESVISE